MMRIETYLPRWHSHVIQLANQVFGDGYFSRPRDIANEVGSVMLVGVEQEHLLGFAQGRVLPQGSLRDHLEHQVSDIPPEVEGADKKGALGTIQAVAIAPAHRRLGIGGRLLLTLHDALIGHGADKLIVTFKKGRTASRVDRIMAELEFEPWLQLPSYWRERCDSGDFKCVDRRHSCICEALLFRKTVF